MRTTVPVSPGLLVAPRHRRALPTWVPLGIFTAHSTVRSPPWPAIVSRSLLLLTLLADSLGAPRRQVRGIGQRSRHQHPAGDVGRAGARRHQDRYASYIHAGFTSLGEEDTYLNSARTMRSAAGTSYLSKRQEPHTDMHQPGGHESAAMSYGSSHYWTESADVGFGKYGWSSRGKSTRIRPR